MINNNTLYASLFNIGDYVKLNNIGELGWVIDKHTSNDKVLIDVKLELDGRVEKGISTRDITVVTFIDRDNDNNNVC